MKQLVGAAPLLLLAMLTPVMAAAPVIRSTPPQAPSQQKAISVDDRLQLMERRIHTLTDILIRLDRIQQEIQQLRGDMELQNHTMATLKERQRDLYSDIDRRMMQLASQKPSSINAPSYPASGNASMRTSPGILSEQIEQIANATIRSPIPPSSNPRGPSFYTPAPVTAPVPSTPIVAPVPAVSVKMPIVKRPQLATLPNVISPTVVQAPVTNIPQTFPPDLSRAVSTLPTVETIPSQQALGAIAPAPVAMLPPADPAFEQPMYKQAYDLLKQRRYDEAKQAFREFLLKYPKGNLAANAQYWVGETSYVLRDFTAAMTEFNKVVQHYPDSSKVPGALLKIAYIQFERKEWVASRKTLEGMVKKHPTTTAARLARDRLERMRIEGN